MAVVVALYHHGYYVASTYGSTSICTTNSRCGGNDVENTILVTVLLLLLLEQGWNMHSCRCRPGDACVFFVSTRLCTLIRTPQAASLYNHTDSSSHPVATQSTHTCSYCCRWVTAQCKDLSLRCEVGTCNPANVPPGQHDDIVVGSLACRYSAARSASPFAAHPAST